MRTVTIETIRGAGLSNTSSILAHLFSLKLVEGRLRVATATIQCSDPAFAGDPAIVDVRRAEHLHRLVSFSDLPVHHALAAVLNTF